MNIGLDKSFIAGDNSANAGRDHEIIKYGSVISISHYMDSQSHIFSDGLVNDRVILKNVSSKGEKKRHNSYDRCLFMVFPTFTNSAKKEALEFLEAKADAFDYEYQETNSPLDKHGLNTHPLLLNSPSINFEKSMEITKEGNLRRVPKDMKKVNELSNMITNEYRYNFDTYQKMKSATLMFNQPIQLIHLASSKYLAYMDEVSEHERDNLKITLEDFPSERTVFKILPAFKFQKDSDQIVLSNETIIIAHLNLPTGKTIYLNYSEELSKLKRLREDVSDNKKKSMLKNSIGSSRNIKKIDINKREVNGSFTDPKFWKVHWFADLREESNKILSCGDVFWLHHSETSSILAAIKKHEVSGEEIDLSETLLEFIPMEIKEASFNNFKGNTLGMWIIEGKNFQDGGPVIFGESYRLKHLSTSSYLSLNKEKGTFVLSLVSRVKGKCLSNETLFQLHSTQTNNSENQIEIAADSFIYIKNVQHNVWLDAQFENQEECLANNRIWKSGEHGGVNTSRLVLPNFKLEKDEYETFRIYKSNSVEVFDINFLISCYPLLTNFLEKVRKFKRIPDINDVILSKFSKKITKTIKCVRTLNDFCYNKISHGAADMKYGHLNKQRQTVLKEQYYIELLVSILEESLSRSDMELFRNSIATTEQPKKQITRQISSPFLRKYSTQGRTDSENKRESRVVFDENARKREFVRMKVKMCEEIYVLLASICKDNHENELYIFPMIPKFQIHVKYISKAIECLINIVSSNEAILQRLSENIRIEYNYSEPEEEEKKVTEVQKEQIINVWINLKNVEENMVVRDSKPVHFEKLNLKPLNLINYFINLILDPKAKRNGDYLRFLSSICCYKDRGVSLNQDIIYKFFSKYKGLNDTAFIKTSVKISDDQMSFLIEPPKDKKDEMDDNETRAIINLEECYTEGSIKSMNFNKENILLKSLGQDGFLKYLKEQLNFFSVLAVDRNYLWKEKFKPLFPIEFLFLKAWNGHLPIDMKSCFCKLAMALYIDHEPFEISMAPDLCRVVNVGEKGKIDPSKRNENYPKAEEYIKNNKTTYMDLIKNAKTYIKLKVKPLKKKGIGYLNNISNDELMLNTIRLMHLLIRLEIINLIDDKKFHFKLLKYLVQVLEFDLRDEEFYSRFKAAQVKRRTRSNKDGNQIGGFLKHGLKKLVKGAQGLQDIIKAATFFEIKKGSTSRLISFDLNKLDDPQMFNHPLMKGYLNLVNRLERFGSSSSDSSMKIEKLMKLEICKILDHYLDLKQNAYISMTIAWYKKVIDDIITKKKAESEDATNAELIKIFEEEISKVTPDIASTGIDIIDFKNKTIFDLGDLKRNISKIIISNANSFFDQLREGSETPDLNEFLTEKQWGQRKKGSIEISILPSLMMALFNTDDHEIETNILKILMRCYNQREEHLKNIRDLEVIFDDEETQLYEFIQKELKTVRNLIGRSEIWLSNFTMNFGNHEKSQIDVLHSLIKIIDNINFYMFSNSVMTPNGTELECSLQDVSFIKTERQNIINFSNGYLPLIELIKRGYYNVSNVVLNPNFPKEGKSIIITLFSKCFNCLTNFCYGNEKCQIVLYKYISIIKNSVNLDLGQINLICAIFSNNKCLLERVDKSLVNFFLELIEKEGRQSKFLKFLLEIQQINDFHLQENQMLILNSFLSGKVLTEQEIKLMYCVQPKSKRIMYFAFDEFLDIYNTNILNILEEVGYRDTYRDEPYLYHGKLLEVLITTAKGNAMSNIASSKLKTIFSAEYFLDLLLEKDMFNIESEEKGLNNFITQQSKDFNKENGEAPNLGYKQRLKGFSYLKPYLLDFLIEIHLKRDKKNVQESYFFSQHVSRYVECERQRIENLVDPAEITPGFCNYLLDKFLNFLILYQDKYLIKVEEKEFDFDDRQDNISFSKLADALYFKAPLFNGKLKAHQLENYKYFLNFHNMNLSEEITLKEEDNKVHKEKERIKIRNNSRKLTANNMIAESKKKQIHSSGSRFFKADFMVNVAIKKESYVENWEIFRERFDDSKALAKLIDEEKRVLSEAIINIDRILEQEGMKRDDHDFDTRTLIKKFIKFINYGVADESNQSTLIIILHVLRRMIDSFPLEKRELIQNLFDKLDAPKMLLTILADHNLNLSPELLIKFLNFGIAMLKGGNKRIQKTVYDYFLNSSKSEYIFQKFHGIIRKHIDSIENIVKEEEKLQENLKEGLRGNTSKSRKINKNIVRKIFRVMENTEGVIMNKVLKFLQLLTEGHNLLLQRYLNKQTNSRNNYDMVGTVLELLRTYYYNALTAGMFENLMKGLDTLIEFVQGPCPENQIAVSDSKFFDIINDLFKDRRKKIAKDDFKHGSSASNSGIISSETNNEGDNVRRSSKRQNKEMEHKLRDLENWQYEQLRYKCMVLLNSLLEMRDVRKNDLILRKIVRAIPFENLESLMLEVYLQHKLLYPNKELRMESFGHVNKHEGEPAEGDDNERKSYYDCILETGFYYFFLIAQISDARIVGEVNSNLQTLRKRRMKKNSDILKNNILGQLASFGTSLVKSAYSYSQILKSKSRSNLRKKTEINEMTSKKKKQNQNSKYQFKLSKAYRFFFSNSTHVEFVRKDVLDKMYFIIPPYCQRLPKEKKIEFHQQVNRESTKRKVAYLIQDSERLITICKHEERLSIFFNNNKFLALFANYVHLWKDIAFCMNILINIFIIGSFSENLGNRMKDYKLFMLPNMSFKETENIFDICGWVMTVCSLFVVIFFLCKNAPLIFIRNWKDDGASRQLNRGMIGRMLSFYYKIIKCLLLSVNDFEVIYYVAYGGLALAATLTHPFFFAFHLTEILLRYPTLKNVILAVWQPRKQLLLTTILLIIIVYVFALFGFYFFHESYKNLCSNTLHCFLYTFDYTFKVNGGIGGLFEQLSLEDENADSKTLYTSRFWFDFVFNITIVIILINLLSGIIIDTFGMLREAEKEKNQDINERCFICGIDKQTFDKTSENPMGGFQNHIRNDHYMWDYVFFIAYLLQKEKTEHTGVETYVREKYDNSDMTWFPFNRALGLKGLEDNEDDIKKKRVATVSGYISETLRQMKKTQTNIKKKVK